MTRRVTTASICAAVTGLAFGIALGLRLGEGNLVDAIAIVVLALALIPVVRVVPPEQRMFVLSVALLAFAVRAAAAALLYTGSVAIGRAGVVTGDDEGYRTLARGYAEHIRGDPEPSISPPSWGGNAYLFGTFIYVETLVFLVVGYQPLVAVFVNGWFAASTLVLLADLTRRLFGSPAARATALVLALTPSLILYSAAMLKEALVLLLISIALWCVARFRKKPRFLLLAAAYTALELIHSIRQYVYVGMSLVLPVGIATIRGVRLRAWLVWTAAAFALSLNLLALNSVVSGDPQVPHRPLLEFERVRQAMATGRTGFGVFPTTVPTSLPTTYPTTAPTTIPTFVGGRPTTVPTTIPTSVPTSVPTTVPTTAPRTIDEQDAGSFSRTLAYLPTGMAYILFAPFPWVVQRPIDALVIPDTLLWYLLLACAAWSGWITRRAWRAHVYLLCYAGGMLLLLALFEGNVGTLHRHRSSTVVPIMAVLAGPGLAALWQWLASRRRGPSLAPLPSRR